MGKKCSSTENDDSICDNNYDGCTKRMEKPFDGSCFCREEVVMLKLNTRANPGRRFFRCPSWQKPRMGYEYFVWVDEVEEEIKKIKLKTERNVGMEILDSEKITKHIAMRSSVIEEHMRRIETLLLLLVIGVALVIIMNMFSLFR